jgi:hypothetical protein
MNRLLLSSRYLVNLAAIATLYAILMLVAGGLAKL